MIEKRIKPEPNASLKIKSEFKLHDEGIESFEVIGDKGQFILSTSRDKSSLLSEILVNGKNEWIPKPTRRFLGSNGIVSSVSINAKEDHFAVSSWDGLSRLYSVNSTETEKLFKDKNGGLISCSIDSEGKRLLTASFDGLIKGFNVETGALLFSFGSLNGGHTGWVNCVKFIPSLQSTQNNSSGKDGNNPIQITSEESKELNFVSVGEDKVLRIWKVNENPKEGMKPASVNDIVGHEEGVLTFAVTRDGRFLATGSRDKTSIIFDIREAGAAKTIKRLKSSGPIKSIDFSPARSELVAVAAGEKVELFDFSKSELPIRVGVPSSYDVARGKNFGSIWVTCVKFSKSGKELIASYSDGYVAIYDLQ